MVKIFKSKSYLLLLISLTLLLITQCDFFSTSLKVGVFEVDVTPPIGSPVAYADARSIQDSLKAKGIVILSGEDPVVLCAVDWVGISNEGQNEWRESLAKAAGTTVNRISVHTVHQHDGCRCDFTTEKILEEYGFGGWKNDTLFLRNVIQSVADAVQKAKQNAVRVTHLGFGEAKVDSVASNRRVLGEDGMVEIVRYSRTTDSLAIAAPEGLIDPWLKVVSFWNDNTPIAVLNYYATHPMSHYGQGDVSSDFVGIARDNREKEIGAPNIYFSGAGGNIAAGKYNDGSPENRPVLTERVEKTMLQAWEKTKKMPISKSDVEWQNTEILLPLGDHLVEEELIALLDSIKTDSLTRFTTAKHLAWLRRTNDGHKVNISALRLANVWLLNLPGETFLEYQLAAQRMKLGDFVCTAAYEEYGPGYLCTEIAYSQGGYESSNRASRVSPEIEKTLLTAIGQVLKSDSESGENSNQ
jgi:hypothetical protein